MLSAMHLGERVVLDDSLDHISVESIGADWQVWMDTGDAPLPRRLVMQFIEAEGAPDYMATFHEWNVDEPIDADVFVADLPEDWQQVDLPER